MRLLVAIAVAAAVMFAAGCTTGPTHPAASSPPLPPDPRTAAGLLAIAIAFNHDYDTGDYGLVYTRWDARSRAIITRADYWFYLHRRWVFDLPLSNPSAVKLYRMSAQQYVATLGCAH